MNSLKRYTPLKRTRLKPISDKRRKRNGKPGKCGIVRLYGKDLKALREMCFHRDHERCVQCARKLVLKRGCWNSMHMAHLRTKRNNGDTLENVRSLCPDCHSKSHNCGGKPLPPKGA